MPPPNPRFQTKPHRLPREHYCGEVRAAFTCCVDGKAALFTDAESVEACVACLALAAERHGCVVPVYCFMPDHVHIILLGQSAEADLWQAMVEFKQRVGFWLKHHRPGRSLQKDFYDHIIRGSEDLGAQVRYVMNNPVRRRLVTDWRDYPFTGAIGIDLETVAGDTTTM
jgi:putative transposase